MKRLIACAAFVLSVIANDTGFADDCRPSWLSAGKLPGGAIDGGHGHYLTTGFRVSPRTISFESLIAEPMYDGYDPMLPRVPGYPFVSHRILYIRLNEVFRQNETP